MVVTKYPAGSVVYFREVNSRNCPISIGKVAAVFTTLEDKPAWKIDCQRSSRTVVVDSENRMWKTVTEAQRKNYGLGKEERR